MSISNRNGMKGFYRTLKGDPLPSCYKVASIARACAVVRSRKKSQARGLKPNRTTLLRPMVCIVSGFFVTAMGRLFIPLRRDSYVDVQLNRHAQKVLAGKELGSLTITSGSISLSNSEEVEPAPVNKVYG